jgi:hypothetical protein
MSSFSNILRLYPTKCENHTEHLSPDVTFPCPYCSGNGWHWNLWEGEPVKKPCLHCGASGKLKAKITVQWEPAGSSISIFKEDGV